MDYTGYGSNLGSIYSFRGQTGIPSGMYGPLSRDMLMPLQRSLAYKQAGVEGKQRMEQMVSMGLPFNTDPNAVRAVGYDPTRQQTVYSAPRPQPWGTWGPLSAGDVSSTGKQQSSKQILASTPFGERVRNEAPAPTLAGSLTGFGGIPRFPYANY